MMRWLIPAAWGFCRLLAFICQLAGVCGILLAALLGVRALAAWLANIP